MEGGKRRCPFGLAGPALERFGAKTVVGGGIALGGLFQCLVPLATGTPLAIAAMLLTAQVVGDGLMTVAFVNDISLRQSIVPDELLGRVTATANLLGAAALPVGALAGGVAGQLASPRAALAVAGVGLILSSLWIVLVPALRTIPSSTKDPTP